MGEDRSPAASGTTQGQVEVRRPNYPRIFINYRRQDTSGHAGRLCDSLEDQLGKGHVFMDIDAIPPGTDYERVIEQSLSDCDVVLIVIGKEWLRGARFGGARLNQRHDFVRLEIEGAMKRRVPVIPVLVQGAQMPAGGSLPVSIAGLTRRNAIELSDARWRFDVDKLTRAIETLPPEDTAVAEVDETRQHQIGTQYSVDGKFLWNGYEWVPVPQTTARFWPRVAAITIDATILYVAIVLIFSLLSIVRLSDLAVVVISLVIFIGVPIAYFTGWWVIRGQTIGMMPFHLKVIRSDGSQLKWGRATWRSVVLLPSLLYFWFAWIFVTTDRRKQALHDRLAGTIVVKVSRKS